MDFRNCRILEIFLRQGSRDVGLVCVRAPRNLARPGLKPTGCAERMAVSFGGRQSPNETGFGAIAVRANVALSSGHYEISARLSFGDCCRDPTQRMKQGNAHPSLMRLDLTENLTDRYDVTGDSLCNETQALARRSRFSWFLISALGSVAAVC